MLKVGIFGGTFDPPHNGHLNIAKYAYEALKLDKFMFIPNGIPAYKLAEHKVSSKKDRLNMLNLAVKDMDFCEVSTIEIDRDGNTYTADTLVQLRNTNPEDKFFLIIGSDSFDYIDKWYKPEVIFSLAAIVVLKRGSDTEEYLNELKDKYLTSYGGEVIILDNDIYDISSTDIRNRLIQGKSVDGLIPKDVEEYIANMSVY